MAKGTSLAAREPLELNLQEREFVITILSFWFSGRLAWFF